MSKQGSGYLRLVSRLMALLLGLYGLLRLLPLGGEALCNPKLYEVGDEENVSGFVVRWESLLFSEEAAVISTLAEGQWVGAGQQVALGYSRSPLTCGEAGYFSTNFDGFERVLTPDTLDRLSRENFFALQEEILPQEVYGRLVTGQSWYFVCLLPQERQKDCPVQKRLSLRLGEDSFPVEVYRLGQAEEGEFLLILRCEQEVHKVLNLRKGEGKLMFGSQEGLLIPKDVLCMEDGKTGVFVLQCGRKRFKEVKILCFSGENALVEEDRSSTRNLRREDQIIVP